jgi:hypothetical protein
MTDQYAKDFDYVAYNRAVKMRVEAEKLHSPLLFEKAAALFTALDMFTAADGCRARAEYYRRTHEQRDSSIR